MLRHLRRALGGGDKLLADQFAGDVGAHLLVGHLPVGQDALVERGIELAIGPAQRRDRGDLAVDRAARDDHALVMAEFLQRHAVDDPLQRAVEPALRDKGRDIERGLFAAIRLHLGVDRLAQLGIADLGIADLGNLRATDAAPHAGDVRHVTRRKGDRDHPQDDEGDDDTGLGIDDPAEETEHGRPIGRRKSGDALRGGRASIKLVPQRRRAIGVEHV